MNCPVCKYNMDALDTFCPKCAKGSATNTTIPKAVEPDLMDAVLHKTNHLLHAPIAPVKSRNAEDLSPRHR